MWAKLAASVSTTTQSMQHCFAFCCCNCCSVRCDEQVMDQIGLNAHLLLAELHQVPVVVVGVDLHRYNRRDDLAACHDLLQLVDCAVTESNSLDQVVVVELFHLLPSLLRLDATPQDRSNANRHCMSTAESKSSEFRTWHGLREHLLCVASNHTIWTTESLPEQQQEWQVKPQQTMIRLGVQPSYTCSAVM